MTTAHPQQPANLDGHTPMAVADLMLLEVMSRSHGTLLLEPQETESQLVFDSGSALTVLARLSHSLAEATLARLAIIADLALQPPAVGRIRLRLASHQGAADIAPIEVLLSLRTTTGGLGAELHALAASHRSGDSSAVSGIDGVPSTQADRVKYEVVGELGRGGMGIVYAARHVQLDKDVALKVLTPAMAQNRALSAQFVVEARAACRVRHPSIVEVTDFGQLADGRNYLVMERVLWPTLLETLGKEPLSTRRALAIALELAQAMAAAHERGVIHRDLKPANVFVGDDNRVKIGDFGLAHTGELDGKESPLDGILFGTLAYMAPEQFEGDTIDRRVDLYAFGCILYQLLTGAPPYDTDDSGEIRERHSSAPVPALVVNNKPGPARLAALCERLLAKERANRPGSFGEVVEELKVCLEETQ